MIAITDHNSTKNVEAVYRAAETTPLVIIPGVEIQTKEEVHSICLFPDLGTLRDFQTILDQTLPDAPNKADFFGEQYIIDETGDFIAYETRLLMNSLELSLTEAFQEVEKRNGLIFPAHIDRKMAGLIANLAFIPDSTPFEVLEISRFITPDKARALYPQIKDFPLLQNGDVHQLEDFLGVNVFSIEKPTLSEIKSAIRKEQGRSFHLDNLQSIP